MKQFVLFLITLSAFACSSRNQAQNQADAFAFDSLLNNGAVQLVDVRTPEEFESGYIRGAVNADINGKGFGEFVAGLDRNKPVLVYCLSGGRSSKAAAYMRKEGLQVTELQGGIASWKAKNLPVENARQDGKSTISREQFISGLEPGRLYLVDFNAKWCLPCKQLLPLVDSLDREYGDSLLVEKVDYDQFEKLASEMQVEGLPYVFLIRDGKILWHHFGLPGREMLTEAIEKELGETVNR